MEPSSTLSYYERHAQQFAESTQQVDFHAIADRFIAMLPSDGNIMDFGCGAGRDTKYFLEKGYSVVAMDGSPALCQLASHYTGIPIYQQLFGEFAEHEAYDGIWACASILHLPWDELQQVLGSLTAGLKSGGILYISFKYGTFQGIRHGRYFTDMDEDRWQNLQETCPELQLEAEWVTGDVREDRGDERWLNLLLRKRLRTMG